MPACAIIGCGKSYGPVSSSGERVRLFGLPTIIVNQCAKTKELSSQRRHLWLSRINRKLEGRKLDNYSIKVCQRHFVYGKPSTLFDFTHPDWAPNIHLGYERKIKDDDVTASMNRYLRTQARSRKRSTNPPSVKNQRGTNGTAEDAAINLPQQLGIESAPPQQPVVCEATTRSETGEDTCNTLQNGHFDPEYSIADQAAQPCEQLSLEEVVLPVVIEERRVHLQAGIMKVENHVGCQADLEHPELVELRGKCADLLKQKTSAENQELLELRAKCADLLKQNILLSEQLSSTTEQVNSLTTFKQQLQVERDMLSKDNKCLREEKRKLKIDFKNISVDEESLRGDDDKTEFFTGIPSFELLKIIYDFVEAEVSHSHRNVAPKFTEFLITLMRIRLGILEQDLAYRFNIAVNTVSKICSRWIKVMSTRLESLITWPERSDLHSTIPQCFKDVFGDRFTVIIDCLEVFVNRPSSLLPRDETFPRYKHHNTAKFLIGITPQGTVCFVSGASDGRSSDKQITLQFGFLDKLLPGDVVLADRGFDMDEEVGMVRAKIAIPAFTKGEAQLSFDDKFKTREIANIRIHVEKMIGFIKRKFSILGSVIPCSYLTKPTDDEAPPIDHIIKICCALANMCPPLIRDRLPNDV